MMKLSHVACAILVTTPAAHAQQVPSAGAQLQQLPQPPAPVKPAPDLVIERPAAAGEVEGGTAITVTALRITGQTLFPEAELRSVSGFVPNSSLTLAQLRLLARNIAEHYHARGYFLAQAYLPEQDVQSGTVTIAVIEGRYGKIDVRNGAKL